MAYDLAPGAKPAPTSLVELQEAAAFCRLNPERLKAWTDSGHAPHYFVDGEGPYYRKKEIADWTKANLVIVRGGLPAPRVLDVLSVVNSIPGRPTVPTSLCRIEGLCHVWLNGICPGIYFLCDGDAVVYVGQSVNVIQRICGHIQEKLKGFDASRVFYLPCPKSDLNRLEREYILAFRPKYNRTIPQPIEDIRQQTEEARQRAITHGNNL